MGLGEPSTIDEVRSIPALAQWAAARYGDAEAVVDGDTRLTFDDLAGSALVATRASMALGIEPGDRVAIWAPNRWEWIVAALGVLGAGAWLVPVNTRCKGDEAAYVLEQADVAALFTVDGFLGADDVGMLQTSAPQLRCLDRVTMIDGTTRDEPAEILVRGFSVMRSYFEDAAATVASSASPTGRRTSPSAAGSTCRPPRWRTSCWAATESPRALRRRASSERRRQGARGPAAGPPRLLTNRSRAAAVVPGAAPQPLAARHTVEF